MATGSSQSSKTRQGIADAASSFQRSSDRQSGESGSAVSASISRIDEDSNAFRQNVQRLGSFKRGGKVKRTGDYKLHRGERVLTKRQAKRLKARRG